MGFNSVAPVMSKARRKNESGRARLLRETVYRLEEEAYARATAAQQKQQQEQQHQPQQQQQQQQSEKYRGGPSPAPARSPPPLPPRLLQRRAMRPAERDALLVALVTKNQAMFGLHKLAGLELDERHEGVPERLEVELRAETTLARTDYPLQLEQELQRRCGRLRSECTAPPRLSLIEWSCWVGGRSGTVKSLLQARSDPFRGSRLEQGRPHGVLGTLRKRASGFAGLDAMLTWTTIHMVRSYLRAAAFCEPLPVAGAGGAAAHAAARAQAEAEGRSASCRACGRAVTPLPLAGVPPEGLTPELACLWPTCLHSFCLACLCATVLGGAGAPELVCSVCNLRQPDDVHPAPWAAAPTRVAIDSVARFRQLPAGDEAAEGDGMQQIAARGEQEEEEDEQDSEPQTPASTSAPRAPDASGVNGGKRGKPRFTARPHSSASRLCLGTDQSVRKGKLFAAAATGDAARLHWLVEAGVDLTPAGGVNEYGQSALFTAAMFGHAAATRELLAAGADCRRRCHLGLSPAAAAALAGHTALAARLAVASAAAAGAPGALLKDDDDDDEEDFVKERGAQLLQAELEALPSFALQLRAADETKPAAGTSVTELIPVDAAHPGAGSWIIDGAFSEQVLEALDTLCRDIPAAPATRVSPECNERRYVCDTMGWIVAAIARALAALRVSGDREQGARQQRRRPPEAPMQFMRFLSYSRPGGYLPPHVDLSRTSNGLRSTHTFILYLQDCVAGGETALLHSIPPCPSEPGARCSMTNCDESFVLALVTPKRGRLLLFPHECPHEGRETVDVPKTLLRGELA
jgi:hypothetical protein